MFSSMLLLKRMVRIGASSGVRSFMIAGLILYTSFALLGSIFPIMLATCFSVTCFKVKAGCCNLVVLVVAVMVVVVVVVGMSVIVRSDSP